MDTLTSLKIFRHVAESGSFTENDMSDRAVSTPSSVTLVKLSLCTDSCSVCR